MDTRASTSLVIAFTIGSIVAVDGAGWQAAASGEPARAVFAETRHEFGTVNQGVKLSHAFKVRNDGNMPLVIRSVDLQEPGMKVSFTASVGAGQAAQITIDWDTSRLQGLVEGRALVNFSDPSRPQVELVLSGSVLPSIEILPMPVVFFSVYKGETAERSITVVNHEARPLQITRVEPGGTHFEATLTPVDPGKVFRLDVRVPRDVAPGRYMEAVYLHTNHPTMSRLAIGVNVLVKNDLYVNPEAVDLGRMSIKELTEQPALLQMLTQSLMVKKRAGEFSIRAISFDLEVLSITRSPVGRGQAFRVDVSLVHEKLKPGPITGTIRIVTDDKEFPELIIPVRGEVY